MTNARVGDWIRYDDPFGVGVVAIVTQTCLGHVEWIQYRRDATSTVQQECLARIEQHHPLWKTRPEWLKRKRKLVMEKRHET